MMKVDISTSKDFPLWRELKEDSILVAHEITPNILLSGDLSYVKGIISEIGGKTSHVGILANTLGIPAVFGIKDSIKIFSDGELLFINGIINTNNNKCRI